METKKLIICVIDSDEINSFVTRRLITKSGIAERTFFFSGGGAALDFFTEHSHDTELLPDLVLFDLNISGMDRWKFLEAFASLRPYFSKKITMYVVSAVLDNADIRRSKTYNQISGYFLKPLTISEFTEMTEKMDR